MEMEFESLDEVVTWAKGQIDEVQKKCDEEVIKYRLQAENATKKLNEELEQERSRARKQTEAEVKASLSSQIASLEVELTDLRAALSKAQTAAKTREKELTAQREEALSQLSSVKRELMNVSDLKARAEKEKEKMQASMQAASEALTNAKSHEEQHITAVTALTAELQQVKLQLQQESAARAAAESDRLKLQSQLQLLTNSMAKAINDRDAVQLRLRETERKLQEAESAVQQSKSESAVVQRTAHELAMRIGEMEVEARRAQMHISNMTSTPPSILRASAQLPSTAASDSTLPPPSSYTQNHYVHHAPSPLSATAPSPLAATTGGGGGFGLRSILQPLNNTSASQADHSPFLGSTGLLSTPSSPSKFRPATQATHAQAPPSTGHGRSLILQMSNHLPPLESPSYTPKSAAGLRQSAAQVTPKSARGNAPGCGLKSTSGASHSPLGTRPLSTTQSREDRVAAAMRLLSRAPVG